ncbi:MAG: DUF5666 domain-containing protein [Anaerolineales bacterium]|nr:DUF5666 domain-containing protein [Anaerolineales bacterium]
MTKKIAIPMIAAMLIALLIGAWAFSDASAQGGSPLAELRRGRGVLGQVTAVADSQFTLQTRQGETRDFLVDENTRFRSREDADLSLEDLQVGRWVEVFAAPAPNETPAARLVIVLPEDFDPSKMKGLRGLVEAVDLTGSLFKLKDRQGEISSVAVDEQTKFRGQAEEFSELEAGMAVFAVVEVQDNGELLAKAVRAGFPIIRRFGEITAVDVAAGEFTLKTARTGEELLFRVDENTRFRSKDDQIAGLGDLQPGMVAAVTARQEPDGALALLVAAGEREDLPNFDLRIAGRVISIADETFTIKGRDGQEYTFQVNAETRFRSPGDRVHGLEDLREGMVVWVGAQELGGGQYLAQLVLAGKPRFSRP